MSEKIAIIGVGRMGKAIIDGYLQTQKTRVSRKQNLLKNWVLISPNMKDYFEAYIQQGAQYLPELTAEIASELQFLILAVKPKQIPKLASQLSVILPEDRLIVSIAAGIECKKIQNWFGDKNRAIIRAMPNTPAKIGQAMTTLFANEDCHKTHIQHVRALFSKIGHTEFIEHEKQMDIVTAISGSGPAYLFLLAEMMIAIAVKEGIPEKTAQKLVAQTVFGSAHLIIEHPDKVQNLRLQVTSPGGSTEAALDILNSDSGFPSIINQAILNAVKRLKEMNRQIE